MCAVGLNICIRMYTRAPILPLRVESVTKDSERMYAKRSGGKMMRGERGWCVVGVALWGCK